MIQNSIKPVPLIDHHRWYQSARSAHPERLIHQEQQKDIGEIIHKLTVIL